jgi:hypothetical protein
MRSHRYTWKSQRLNPPVEWTVIVYADRSVEMSMTTFDTPPYVVRRPSYLQTREEAAFFLKMGRDGYTIEKTWL